MTDSKQTTHNSLNTACIFWQIWIFGKSEPQQSCIKKTYLNLHRV